MVITIGSVLVTVVSYSMFMLRCFPCRSGVYLALSFFGIYYHSYPWGAIYLLLALAERLVAQQDFLVKHKQPVVFKEGAGMVCSSHQGGSGITVRGL